MAIKKYIIFVICFFSSLHGDWNTSFDENTFQLLSYFPDSEIEEYKRSYENFMYIRDGYLRDSGLKKKIASMVKSEKELILRPEEGVVLKIRDDNHLYEVFAWEISTLLGSYSCVVPSFSIDIGGKQIVMQKMESFAVREKGTKFSREGAIRSVGLDAYWVAHLQAYLLGMGDLVERNIGINGKGQIRFFDLKSSFKYKRYPTKSGNTCSTGFIAQSFAWDQFEAPLDQMTVIFLQRYIDSLAFLEERMAMYLVYRPFCLDEEGFFYRLKKIREFSLGKGTTFEDFYRFIFPEVGVGLDELCFIVSQILQKNVTSGEALCFIHKDVKKTHLRNEERREIQKWLARYIK